MNEILILTTGGTIDKEYFDALSDYQIGASVIDRLLSAALVAPSFEVVELMRKDSLDLDESDREAIVSAVKATDRDRIIISHGTDTMTATASALASIGDKTIILVGALKPARFAESDAAFNLGMAFAAAQLAGPGVYIAMNGQVSDGLRVRKDRTANMFVSL